MVVEISLLLFDVCCWICLLCLYLNRLSCFVVVGTHFRTRRAHSTLMTLGALLDYYILFILAHFLAALFLNIDADVKAIVWTVFEVLIFRREMAHSHI